MLEASIINKKINTDIKCIIVFIKNKWMTVSHLSNH